MLELTRDVDKLITRAKTLQERGERARKQDRADLREQRLYQRKPSVDVKVINNNTTEPGNSASLNNTFSLLKKKKHFHFMDNEYIEIRF